MSGIIHLSLRRRRSRRQRSHPGRESLRQRWIRDAPLLTAFGRRGAPVSSCEQGAGWTTPTSGRLVADGFEIGSHQIAAYRFAPRENALAALLVEGHPESVGSIEVCFFSVKTREARDAGGETTSPAPPVLETKENQRAPTIIAAVREDKTLPEMRRTRDVLLSRVRLVTEDSAGQALGAAPPPPVARTIPPPSASPPATLSSPDDAMESPPPRGRAKTDVAHQVGEAAGER